MAVTVQKLIILGTLGALAAGGWEFIAKESGRAAGQQAPNQHQLSQELFSPAAAQWTTLSIEPVTKQVFRYEHVTEGKIAIDEDHSTLVTSLYSGRILRLVAKAGDDPAGASQTARWVGIFLAFGLAFKGGDQRLDGLGFCFAEHQFGR